MVQLAAVRNWTMVTVMTAPLRPPKRWPAYAFGAVVVIVVSAICSWALITVLRPAEEPLTATDHTYAVVTPGEVGASLNLNVIAEWTSVPIGVNNAAGVLTGIDVEAGREVDQGSQLYSVNLRPVIIAEGEVPAFRAITPGVRGADVQQLQSMLAALGYYGGPIDGGAGAATVRAIGDWQGSLGLERTGIVELGDMIFVQALPTRVTLDPEVVQLGATLSGGERILSGLPASPAFKLSVTEAQAAMIPTGTPLEISSPDGKIWRGVTADRVGDVDTDATVMRVVGDSGGVICGSDCSTIPVSGEVSLGAKVITVPTVSGLVAPSGALITTVNGDTAVVDANGTRFTVTVKASAKGMSVISGVEEGLQVRVPGFESATQ